VAGAQPLLTISPYIVAQSDYGGQNGNPGGAIVGYPYAQTFTATRGGTLFSLGAGFYAPQSGLVPYYTFQFRDTTPGGLPSSQILASLNQSTAILSSPANAWIDLTADFSSFGINLIAGHKYSFSVDEPGQIGTTTFNNFFWGFTGSGYSGGETYYFPLDGTAPRELFPGEDFLFTVTAVPEPGMGIAILWGMGCVWWLMNRPGRKLV